MRKNIIPTLIMLILADSWNDVYPFLKDEAAKTNTPIDNWAVEVLNILVNEFVKSRGK